MRHLLQASVVMLLVLGFVQTSSASALSSLLSFDGAEDTLNDNSQNKIFDMDGDDALSAGDQIVGLFQIEKVNVTGDPSPGAIFAATAFEIRTPFLTSGGDLAFDLVPIYHSDTNSLMNLIDPALHPAGFTASDWDQTVGLVFSIDDVSSGAGTDASVNPYDPAHTEANTSIISSVLTAVNGYSLDVALGIVGSYDMSGTTFTNSANANGDTDFLQAKVTDSSFTTISGIEADDNGAQILSQRGGFTVLANTFGSSTKFLPLDVLRFSASGTTDHDVVLQPDGAVQTTELTDTDANWSVVDDANFKINAVPEPTSMLAWGGLASILGLAAARRRKRNA